MYLTTQVRALGMPFLSVVHGSPASEPSWILENSDSLLIVHLRAWGSIYFIWFLSRDVSFSFRFCSVAKLCLTLCDLMDCSTPGLPVHHQLMSLLKLMSIESVMPSNHLILCRPLLLPPSIFPSIGLFQ